VINIDIYRTVALLREMLGIYMLIYLSRYLDQERAIEVTFSVFESSFHLLLPV